jgi:hypothetical protein
MEKLGSKIDVIHEKENMNIMKSGMIICRDW